MSTLAASRISEAEKQLCFAQESLTTFEHFVNGVRGKDSRSSFSLGNHCVNI